MYKQIISNEIKAKALQLGFDACGIAKADYLEADARYLQTWLEGENQAAMSYMANHFEKRTDPRLLVHNAHSVIVVLMNYYPQQQQTPHLPQIAKYAYGKDYHEVIKNKLRSLLEQIQTLMPGEKISGRVFTDSAPVLERRWAVNAGLGWIGKHDLLITPKFGSALIICTILTNAPLSTAPLTSSIPKCGNCTICVDICPTRAIKGMTWNINRSREELVDVYNCTMCLKCLAFCPWTIKYMKNNL